PHGGVGRHGQQVALLPLPQLLPEPGAPAHLVVAADPGVRQPRAAAAQHLQGQLVPRPEADRPGDPRPGPPPFVAGPRLGQVQADIDQGVLAAADVGQVDADLAVVDLAQAAAPLPLHPDRGTPLLGEGRRVEDQHAVGAAQLLADLASQLGEPGLVGPRGLADELLQRLAFLVVQVGDGLDVLVLQRGDQAGDVVAGVGCLLAPLEVLDEGVEEAFQAGQDAAGDAGIDFGVGQEVVAAGGPAAFHRQLLPRTPFSGRALYKTAWRLSSKGPSRTIVPK